MKVIIQNIEDICAYVDDEITTLRAYVQAGKWDKAQKRAEEVESLAQEILNYINDAKEES